MIHIHKSKIDVFVKEKYKMEKAWYLSKGVWGGVLVFIGAGLSAIGFADVGSVLTTAGVGLGFIGVRLAQK